MPSDKWYLRLADITSSQSGLVTTAQARTVGVSPQQVARLTTAGTLEPLIHGVHRLAGSPHDPHAELRAAWLAVEPESLAESRLERTDPGAVVVDRSAAVLHELGDIDADLIEFATSTRKRSRNPAVRIKTRLYSRSSWTVVDGLPVTSVAATIADLAANRLDGGHLAAIVRDALTQNKISLEDAIAAVCPYAHKYGHPLGDGQGLVDSLLEQAGIPEATISLGTSRPIFDKLLLRLNEQHAR